jgi:hypothetical protein
MRQPAGEVHPCRHEQGEVVEAGVAGGASGTRLLDEDEQFPAVDA